MIKYGRKPSTDVPRHRVNSLTQRAFSQRQLLAALLKQGIQINRLTLLNPLADAAFNASHPASGHGKIVTERDERYLARVIRVHKVASATRLNMDVKIIVTDGSYRTVIRRFTRI